MGMRMNNIKMTTVVEREKLMETLRKNLKLHSQSVKEARAGYIEKAKTELVERLEALKTGKTVSLMFGLRLPEDYSEVYRSTIKMLEWNVQPTIELGADQFRQLVEDKWDWTQGFYSTNAAYSSSAAHFGGVSADFSPEG